MKKQKSGKNTTYILTSVTALLFVAVAVFVVLSLNRSEAAAAALRTAPETAGTAYIEEMERVPAAAIEERILREERTRIDEARLEELLADPSQLFTEMQENNIVLVGESRTSGFSYYGWVDDNHFLGGVGWSILEVPSLYDQIAALQPSALVFCFGINELPRQLGEAVFISSPEIYMETLQASFDTIQQSVPGVRIYMNCIVPCSEIGYLEAPGYTVIPEWNRYIESYCKDHGYGYIDISDLCEEHMDMYREDGMHLVSEFYPYWGARILQVIMNDE